MTSNSTRALRRATGHPPYTEYHMRKRGGGTGPFSPSRVSEFPCLDPTHPLAEAPPMRKRSAEGCHISHFAHFAFIFPRLRKHRGGVLRAVTCHKRAAGTRGVFALFFWGVLACLPSTPSSALWSGPCPRSGAPRRLSCGSRGPRRCAERPSWRVRVPVRADTPTVIPSALTPFAHATPPISTSTHAHTHTHHTLQTSTNDFFTHIQPICPNPLPHVILNARYWTDTNN